MVMSIVWLRATLLGGTQPEAAAGTIRAARLYGDNEAKRACHRVRAVVRRLQRARNGGDGSLVAPIHRGDRSLVAASTPDRG